MPESKFINRQMRTILVKHHIDAGAGRRGTRHSIITPATSHTTFVPISFALSTNGNYLGYDT